MTTGPEFEIIQVEREAPAMTATALFVDSLTGTTQVTTWLTPDSDEFNDFLQARQASNARAGGNGLTVVTL